MASGSTSTPSSISAARLAARLARGRGIRGKRVRTLAARDQRRQRHRRHRFRADPGQRIDRSCAAQLAQLPLEYAPGPPFDAGRPETVPPQAPERAQRQLADVLAAHRAIVEQMTAA